MRKVFIRGIVGTKPPHIMTTDEQNKIVPKEDLFIDIGADNIAQANMKGADVGMMGVFDVEFMDLGDGYFRGKALDDRAGCVVLAETFKALQDSPYNVVAVGSVQEELGIRGARTAAWQVEPDIWTRAGRNLRCGCSWHQTRSRVFKNKRWASSNHNG